MKLHLVNLATVWYKLVCNCNSTVCRPVWQSQTNYRLKALRMFHRLDTDCDLELSVFLHPPYILYINNNNNNIPDVFADGGNVDRLRRTALMSTSFCHKSFFNVPLS